MIIWANHSPNISIVVYRETLVQDPVLVLKARTTPRKHDTMRVRRLQPYLALRLLCKRLFYGRAMGYLLKMYYSAFIV